MSRKDYVILAQTISDQADTFKSTTAHARFASSLADTLASDNPRFDRVRFILACMPRTYVGTRHSNPWERIARKVA